MDVSQWEQGIQAHIPALETFLKNGLQQPYSIQPQNTAAGNHEDAASIIGQAETIVRFVEKNFHSEIFLGFSQPWSEVLADQVSNDQTKSFVGNELIVELSNHFTTVVSQAMAEMGVKIEFAGLGVVPKKKLDHAFNLQQYFTTHLHITPEDGSALDLWLAISHPNKKMVDKYARKLEVENLFSTDEYSETAVRFAEHIDIQTDHSESNNKPGISMKGQQVEFEDFGKQKNANNKHEVRNIDMLKDIEMRVSVELGRREMTLGKILQMVKGSVVELEKLAGEPVEILVNGHKIAQGDVVVIDEHFGVRISNLLASKERIKELQ